MKTTNALVTYTDLSTMSLVPKGSPATGDRIATKLFVTTNYYVDEAASPFSSYSNDRCPPYQTIIPLCYSLPYTYTLYYDYDDSLPNVIGFDVPEDACTATNSVTVYSSSSSIGIGTTIWYNYCGTIPMAVHPQSETQNNYRIGTDIIQFSDVDGSIASITSCTPATYLDVYAKDINSTNSTLIYGINGGGYSFLATVPSSTCGYVGTVSGLNNGDTVEILVSEGYYLKGITGTTCPTGAGNSCLYSVDISTGPNYAAILVDSNNSCY